MGLPNLALASLRDLGPFTITLQGEATEAFLSQRPCVYFEWSYGVKAPGASDWTVSWSGYRTSSPFTALTPRGPLPINLNEVRLFLSPAVEREWSRADKDKGEAPKVVAQRLAAHTPVSAAEHCLEAGREYFAVVSAEDFNLPPAAGSRVAKKARQWVLWISDQPFSAEGKPQVAPTPTYQHWNH